MTVHEEIENLKHIIDLWEDDENMYSNSMDIEIDQEFIDTIHKAKTALEKQIPKKHVYKNGNYNCPICSHPALSVCARRKNYCDNCGQKLDWSDRIL